MNTHDLDREAITLDLSRKILEEIKAGDLDHGLSVAEMLLSEGPRFNPDLLIVLVESVIELAAQAGSSNAREYLEEKWPALEAGHLRRLTRKAD